MKVSAQVLQKELEFMLHDVSRFLYCTVLAHEMEMKRKTSGVVKMLLHQGIAGKMSEGQETGEMHRQHEYNYRDEPNMQQ